MSESELDKINDEVLDDDAILDNDKLDYNDFGEDYGTDSETPMQKHADLLKGLTNFDPYIKGSINGFLGLVWNEEKEKYVRDARIRPVLNFQGSSWCVEFLKTYVRDNNIITNLRSEEYKDIMLEIIEDIWLNLGTRMEEFDIKNHGDLLTIANKLQHSASLILLGAGDGKYNQLLSTTISRNESVNLSDDRNNYNPTSSATSNPSSFLDKIKNRLMKI